MSENQEKPKEPERRLCDNLWNVVASIGDAIDNDRTHTDTQWRLYMHELHEWISDLIIEQMKILEQNSSDKIDEHQTKLGEYN
jgi:hypothetical protein